VTDCSSALVVCEDSTHIFSLISLECAEGYGLIRRYNDRCSDPWKDHNALVVFTYTLVSTVNLV